MANKWYPSRDQLDSPDDLERSVREVLRQLYALQDKVNSDPPAPKPVNGGTSQTNATVTRMLGLPVQPTDTSQLQNGYVLQYDLGNRQFKFGPSSGVAGVTSLNALVGALTIAAGSGISVGAAVSTITVANTGVLSMNALTGALSIVAGSGITVTPGGTTITIAATGSGTGTVTSVALSAPGEFTVSGSPVSTAGTLTLTKANQSANTVWAGPTSGGAAAPTFRALVAADIPSGVIPNFADAETPSGSLPGTSFTLAHSPSPAASLLLFWNGQLLAPSGVDYTLSGASITTVPTIGGGDILLAWYRY